MSSKTKESRSFADIVRHNGRWVVVRRTEVTVSDARRMSFAVRQKAGKWRNTSKQKRCVESDVVDAYPVEFRRRQTHEDAANASRCKRRRYRQLRPRASVVYKELAIDVALFDLTFNDDRA